MQRLFIPLRRAEEEVEVEGEKEEKKKKQGFNESRGCHGPVRYDRARVKKKKRKKERGKSQALASIASHPINDEHESIVVLSAAEKQCGGERK